MSLANRRTDRFACLDKSADIKNSMSLGLVVLEKKLFTRTRTPTPQSDDIMSADIKRPYISCIIGLRRTLKITCRES